MQESVNRYADGVRRTEGVPIQIRVGLNSGEVVVGSIGNDLKMDYTAIGQTVHLAARMEQMAAPGTIMLAADSLRLAEGYVQVKPIGPVHVKGMANPSKSMSLPALGGANTVTSRSRARPHSLCRARSRNRATSHGPRESKQRSRSSGCGCGRAWFGKVAAVLRIHPLASHRGLVDRRIRLGLLWQGHAISSSDRPS